jgi:hypothetical protein
MWSRPNFLVPGHDGNLAAETDIWRKGIVYTRRSPMAAPQTVERTYRISVAFKRREDAVDASSGYSQLYRRVRTIAILATAKLACLQTGSMLTRNVVCHGWRNLREGSGIVNAFIAVDLHCAGSEAGEWSGEPEPTQEMLLSPGGTSLEDLARIGLQRADEFYNEFDFTEACTADTDPITFSHGERTSGDGAIDFKPFVERAEQLAKDYYRFLQSVQEMHAQVFRIVRREWFLADRNFVTIHICFER